MVFKVRELVSQYIVKLHHLDKKDEDIILSNSEKISCLTPFILINVRKMGKYMTHYMPKYRNYFRPEFI